VHLLDTPGFDDHTLLDSEILAMISDCLEDSFKDGVDIVGVLYMHPITDPRMKRSAMKNLRLFKKIVGMEQGEMAKEARGLRERPRDTE